MRSFLEIPELEATARHIEVVQGRIRRLQEVRRDSWSQILTSAARMFRLGEIDLATLHALMQQMRASYGTGWTELWQAHMPVSYRELPGDYARLIASARYVPNGTHGSWFGTFPIHQSERVVPDGMAVVYVLWDDADVVAYIGSTASFKTRMATHVREGKANYLRWTAYPCPDRNEAYELEERLLAAHRPYLNKKVTR